MNRYRKELTLLDFIMFIGFIFSFLFWVPFWMANIYFTENGVLRELRNEFPKTERVVKIERNFFSKSIIIVEEKNGDRPIYELDSNILFNYEFKK